MDMRERDKRWPRYGDCDQEVAEGFIINISGNNNNNNVLIEKKENYYKGRRVDRGMGL